MLHHHGHEKPLTEADRAELLSEGAAIQGMVVSNEPSAADRRIAHVRISVNFKDGQRAEFSEELASLYQPEPGSQEAKRIAEARGAGQLRHPDRIPKIQLRLFGGEMVPVRYAAADRSKIVIDGPALRKRALHDYIQHERKQQEGAQSGPSWAVPAYCPNCGAPVDQAKAARDRDPVCPFCHQPVPVQPPVSQG